MTVAFSGICFLGGFLAVSKSHITPHTYTPLTLEVTFPFHIKLGNCYETFIWSESYIFRPLNCFSEKLYIFFFMEKKKIMCGTSRNFFSLQASFHYQGRKVYFLNRKKLFPLILESLKISQTNIYNNIDLNN